MARSKRQSSGTQTERQVEVQEMVFHQGAQKPMVIQSNGETLAEEPDMLVGRNYEIMQNELDGDFSKMHED